jgi:diadenosine tetraphosphate (Ap4A) HIT family hydrolase
MTPRLDCVFCTDVTNVVASTDRFYLKIDDAPIRPGHLLVCSVAHYSSLADMPGVAVGAVQDWVTGLVDELTPVFGPMAVMEHGRTGHCVRARGSDHLCEHAHVHLVPCGPGLLEAVTSSQAVELDDWTVITDLAADLEGYMLVKPAEMATATFIPVVRPLPSHFLRAAVAESWRQPDRANWEGMIGALETLERVVETSYRLAAADLTPSAGIARRVQA